MNPGVVMGLSEGVGYWLETRLLGPGVNPGVRSGVLAGVHDGGR